MKLKNVSVCELNPEREVNARRKPKSVGVASGRLSAHLGDGATTIKSKNRSLCPHTGKRRYRDAQAAKLALRRSQSAGGIETELYGTTKRHEQRFYLCPSCRGFHLTSKQALESLAAYGTVAA